MRQDHTTLLLLLGAAVLLGGGGYAVYTMTTGLRNNNPGNIRDDGMTDWEGLDNPRSDGTFLRFISPEYGIRALGRILHNYVMLDGVAPTVAGIIARWAPPSENDTAAYIADVAGKLRIDPDAAIDFAHYTAALTAAIIAHENGFNPYTSDVITRGLALA